MQKGDGISSLVLNNPLLDASEKHLQPIEHMSVLARHLQKLNATSQTLEP